MTPRERPPAARHAYGGLDRLLHEKARLSILTALAARGAAISFPELKRACALTDGNLSRHLAALEAAGIVALAKGFTGRRPSTTCRFTPQGRARFLAYVAVLEDLVRDALGDGQSATARPAPS